MAEDTTDDGTCPVCGQPYDHKREERRSENPKVRSDVAVCKTTRLGDRRQVFIHVDRQPVVSRVTSSDRQDTGNSLAGGLFE